MADGAEALTGWGGADPSTPDHTTARNPKVAVPALQLAQKSENYDQLAFSCAIDLENAAITMNDEIDAMLQRSRYLVNKQETRNLKLMHRFKRSEEDLDKEIRNIETALDEQEETSLLEGRSRAKSSRGLAHIQTLLETAPSLALRGGKAKVGKTKKVGGKHKGGAIAVGGGRTMTSTPASMLVPSLSSTAKAHAVLTGAGAGAGAGQSGKLKKKKKKAKRRKKKSGAGKKLSPIATRVHASENYVTCFEERDQLLAALEVGCLVVRGEEHSDGRVHLLSSSSRAGERSYATQRRACALAVAEFPGGREMTWPPLTSLVTLTLQSFNRPSESGKRIASSPSHRCLLVPRTRLASPRRLKKREKPRAAFCSR